ncbi:hypothetical protein HDU92_005973, partial [Lobulomyces angularis]
RFEKLSDEYKNVNFLKVDVDNNQDISKENSGKINVSLLCCFLLTRRLKVSAMPTFKFFINGKCVDEVVGADINKVENIIKRLSDGAGAASFTGGGRVLGSGATANASTTQDKNHQYLMYGLILVFLGYIYFSKGSGEL